MTPVLALRNLLRHRGRTLMTLAAIAFGVAALILAGGFVQDIYAQLGEALIHSQSGHLQTGRAALFAEGSRSPEKLLLPDPDAEKARVRAVSPGATPMARLSFSGLVGNGRSDLPVTAEGIEPGPEATLGTSVQFVAGRALAPKDRFGVIVGEGLAAALDLKPGDVANVVAPTVEGAMNTLEFEVVGVFRSFSKDYDANTIKVPLAAAQELLGTKGANVIVVLLASTADTDKVAAALAKEVGSRGLVVKTWRELNDFYESTVALYDRQFGVLNLIILVMVVLGVSNAVNMSVLERLGEFGTVRALGRRSRDVVALVVAENAILGVAGALAGVVAGIVLAIGISAIGIPMPPPPNSNSGYVATIRLVPAVIAGAFVIGVIATLLAAAIPAWRVSRVPVADALRENV